MPNFLNSSSKSSLSKSYRTPIMSSAAEGLSSLGVLTNSRSVKRASDVHESSGMQRSSEEDEDDQFISNQDLEALCAKQSVAKRKKV